MQQRSYETTSKHPSTSARESGNKRYQKLPEVLFQELARLAPTLKEAELRVLTHLCAQAAKTGSLSISASSRQLEVAVKVARRNIVNALDSLADRGLIATRQGHATKTAVHMLRFADVLKMSGVATTPPPVPGGVEEVGSFQLHPGVETAPPPTENTGLTPVPSALDISTDSIEVLDRVLRPPLKPRNALREWAETITIQARRLRREYRTSPDNTCMAELMEACGDNHHTLEWLIIQIANGNHQPGESPTWWTSVALQRIHGIPAKVTAARRAELSGKPKLIRRPGGTWNLASDPPHAAETPALAEQSEAPTSAAVEPSDTAMVDELTDAIARTAAAKALG